MTDPRATKGQFGSWRHRSLGVIDRQERALDLRVAGKTFKEIAILVDAPLEDVENFFRRLRMASQEPRA